MKLSKVTIICNAAKFEQLKAAMNDIGVTGMTVAQVQGCGVQKGKTEYYRGVAMSMNLLPKLQIDIVVSKVPVAQVAMAWIFNRQPLDVFALSGSTHVENMKLNIAASEMKLSPAECAWLDLETDDR